MQPDGNSFPPFVLSIPAEAAAAAPAGSYQLPIMLGKNLSPALPAYPWATRTQWRQATEPIGADLGQILWNLK